MHIDAREMSPTQTFCHIIEYPLYNFKKTHYKLVKFDFSLVTKAEKREIAPPFVTPNYAVPK